MKQAIMALDGGGSKLRMLIVDRETREQLYFRQINSGTNLSTVPDRKQALNNIKGLIIDGHLHIPRDYVLTGIGLSSAGTEIPENKQALKEALEEVIDTLKISSDRINDNPPKLFVTNDIDILLAEADIAIVGGTGTVAATKYKDIRPYDNTDEIPEGYVVKRFDGAGPFIGDKGSGYWLGKEILTKVQEIESLGGFINGKGEFIEENNSYLRELVLERLFEENGISEDVARRAIDTSLAHAGAPEFVSLVYGVTKENGYDFDRAKVAKFAPLADRAASQGDAAANEILKQAAVELGKNIVVAYESGGFRNKEHCDILLAKF